MKRDVLDHVNIMKFADFNFYIGDTLIPLEKLISVSPILQQSGYVFEQVDGWDDYLITSSQFNEKTKAIDSEISQINNKVEGLGFLSQWYGAKVGIVGDSISSVATQSKKWHRFIGEKLNLDN